MNFMSPTAMLAAFTVSLTEEKSSAVETSSFMLFTLDAVTLSMVTTTEAIAWLIALLFVIVATEALFLLPHLIYVQLFFHWLLLKFAMDHVISPIFASHVCA